MLLHLLNSLAEQALNLFLHNIYSFFGQVLLNFAICNIYSEVSDFIQQMPKVLIEIPVGKYVIIKEGNKVFIYQMVILLVWCVLIDEVGRTQIVNRGWADRKVKERLIESI